MFDIALVSGVQLKNNRLYSQGAKRLLRTERFHNFQGKTAKNSTDSSVAVLTLC